MRWAWLTSSAHQKKELFWRHAELAMTPLEHDTMGVQQNRACSTTCIINVPEQSEQCVVQINNSVSNNSKM